MPGNGVRPMAAPKAVYGMNVVRAIPAALARMTGIDALLSMKGTCGVRIICMMSVWLHMDSMNQPA